MTTKVKAKQAERRDSMDQKMAALVKANAIRSRRKNLKVKVRAGKVKIEDLLLDPPEWLETARFVEILKETPKIGDSKVLQIQRLFDLSPGKTFRGLTQRQRNQLAACISRWRQNGRFTLTAEG